MKRTLVIHVRSWHLAVGLVLVVALSGGTAVAVGPTSFRPAGTFMVASASSRDPLAVGSSATVVLSRAISVPTGKTADLFASFNVETTCSESNGGSVAGGIRLDSPTGIEFAPGLFGQGWPSDEAAVAHLLSFQGYKYSVPAGPHTVYATMIGGCPDGAQAFTRSLTIIANIHD